MSEMIEQNQNTDISGGFIDNKHRFLYVRKVVNKWRESKYNKYEGKINELPKKIYLRVIDNEYNIYNGILTKVDFENKQLKLKNTYKDEKYNIDFDKLVELDDDDDDDDDDEDDVYDIEQYIGIYVNQEQLKQKRKSKVPNYF